MDHLADCEVALLSLNVRGLNDRSKRLKLFHWVKNLNIDIVMFQETISYETCENDWMNDWETKNAFFSHGTNHSKGCLTIINSRLDIKVLNTQIDTKGRYIILELEINDEKYTVSNIYAPNDISYKDKYFKELKETLITCNVDESSNLILGGDWNTILLDIDRYSMQTSAKDSSLLQVENIIEHFNLCDIWRVRNPIFRRHTYRRTKPLYQSRLDYLLISNALQDIVVLSDIIPSIYSDHSAIIFGFNTLHEKYRGKGYWKFNSALLKDTVYTDRLSEKLKEWVEQYKMLNSKQIQWEILKYEIRKFTIEYSKKIKRKQTNREHSLRQELMNLENILGHRPSDDLIGQVENVKNELTKIDDNKLQGSIIRSKIKWTEEGEKSSKYFFRLEKQNYVKKHIRKLQTDSGQIITDPEKIATYQRRFYSKLLSAKEINVNLNEETFFLNNKTIPKLSESQRQLCEGQVTVEECTNILNTFKENKSPGNDGLTIEFYKFFWDKINTSLISSFNESFQKGELSSSQRQAVITLLQKPGKNR